MRKGIIRHTRVICLEEIKDYYNKYLEYFTNKYRMRDVMGPKMLIRNTTNEAGVLPSDNYIYEFLINERLLGFVYFRRNSFNNCEVVMVDLNIRIPKKYYKKSKKYDMI